VSPNRSNPATYGYVIETGRVALEGRHDALIADDRVRRAYFGM
jgi:branched-chain amino acid transport system ATP-binding protein